MPRRERRKRSRARRVGSTIVVVFVVVLLAIVTALLSILYVPAASRLVLGRAVSWYAGNVPGDVRVGAFEGAIARGVRLHDVRLEDARGRPVASARLLRIRLRAWPLLLARARVELSLDSGAVHLWPDGGFADLVPERDEPPDPDEPVGPDLPISVAAELDLRNVDITSHAPEGTETPVARDLSVRAGLSARGRDARLEIDSASGRLFDATTLTDLEATVSWSAPQLELELLTATTDIGRIEHARGSLDAETNAFAAELALLVQTAALLEDVEPGSPLEGIEELALRARTRGSPEGLWAWIEASADEILDARVSGFAALAPLPAVSLDWRVQADLPDQPSLHVQGFAGARQYEAGLDAALLATCTSCPEPVLLGVRGARTEDAWWAHALGWLPGVELRARARGPSDALARAALDLDIERVGPLRRALAPWFELPEVEARARARVQCRGERFEHCRLAAEARDLAMPDVAARWLAASGEVRIEDEQRVGEAELQVRGIRRGDTRIGDLEASARGTLEALEIEARLDGTHDTRGRLDVLVQPGERTLIDLRGLEAVHRELRATLLDTARIELEDGEVDIDGLRLRLGTGTIALDGHASTRDASDLRLSLTDIDLAELAPVVPGPSLGGRLSAALSLRGTLDDPLVAMTLRGRALAVDEFSVGALDGRLLFRDATLSADLQTRGGVARRARLELRLPVRVDLGEGRFAVPPRRRLHVDGEVQALALSVLSPSVAGLVDARFGAEGTMAAPVLSASLEARAVGIEGGRVGDARALVSYEDERADLRFELRGPLVRRLDGSASLPLTIDLARASIEVHQHRELQLAMHAQRANLAALDTWLEDWALAGAADLTLTARGSVSDWHAHTVMKVGELAYDGRELGDALVDFAMTPAGSDLDLRVTGPIARRLHVRARAPASIDLARLEPTWDLHETHEIDGLLEQVDLAALGMGPGLPITGRVDGLVHVEGSVDDASGVIDLATRRLAWRGQRLGRVWLAARYDGSRVVALAEQQSGLGEWIRARFEAPVGLADEAPWIDWKHDETHRLSLHAAGVDEHLLGAFFELPPETRIDTSARVVGAGNLEDFRIDGRIRGNFGRNTLAATNFHASLEIGPYEQALRALVGANGIETVNLVAQMQAPVVALARGEVDAADVPIEARMDADRFPLDAFEPLLPTSLDDVRGFLQARAFGSGTLGAPDLRGFVEIQDGSVTVVPMMQRLDDIDLFMLFDGSRVRLDELRLRSGRGTTLARGQVLLGTGETRGHLYLQANDLPLVRPGLPIMTLDTRLVATFDARDEMTEISVTAEDLSMQVLATNVDAPASIPSSDDVVIVGQTRPTADLEADPEAPPGDVRLRFRLDRPALIGGPNADMEWNGELEVTRTDGVTRVEGALEATRGRVLLLDREFEIERGLVTLPAEEVVDPFIDLVATTQMPDASVTVTIRGRASRPDLRLTSSPPLTETEIFSLLVTGSTGAARDEGTEFDAQAAAMLAVFNNPVIARHVRETIGIDRVGVAFGEDIENPILTVGKRLTRQLYLETRYHHDAPPNTNTAEVRLDYAFRPPSWSLQTHFGDAAVGGVEVWWQRRFGGGHGRGRRQPLVEPPARGRSGPEASTDSTRGRPVADR